MRPATSIPCFLLLSLLILAGGCLKDPDAPAVTAGDKPAENAAAEQSPTGIFGKTTREVGEFNPETGSKEAELAVDPDSGYLTAVAGGAKYAMAQSVKLGIEHAMQIFNALHDRYPKDVDEFMKEIIDANNFELPVLPGKLKYEYDVKNHELKVVEGKK